MTSCKTCGNKILGNPIELGMIDLLGYHKYDFCNLDCFLDFIAKNYKGKLKRRLK